jgi:hypothetical protein
MGYFGTVWSHGLGRKYSGINIPVAVCNELKIRGGTPVIIKKESSSSFLVEILKGV